MTLNLRSIEHVFITIAMLVLLTFSFWKTQTFNLDQHYQITAQLRYIKQINAVTNTNIIKSRFSILANYDSLVKNISLLQSETDNLSKYFAAIQPNINQEVITKLKQLKIVLRQKEINIEKFKSQNAILKNSFLYFPKVTQDLIYKLNDIQEYSLSSQLSQLLQSQFAYNYNLNIQDNLPTINNLLNELAEIQLSQPELAEQLTNVTLHGKIIIRLKPLLDQLMSESISLSTDEYINNLAVAYEQASKQMLLRTNRYRLLLYLTAIILLIYTASLYRLSQRHKILQNVNKQLEDQVEQRTKDLHKTLRELKQSQAQLIQAEKMSSLGRLVAGIAHEINNPISFIHGNIAHVKTYTQDLLNLSNLYQQEFPEATAIIQEKIAEIDLDFLEEDLPKIMASMQVGTERVRQIVDSLRTFSHLDESAIKSVDLHAGIDSTLMILNSRLQALSSSLDEIKVIKNYAQLPLVKCYARQLNQVFLHILSNAIDALELAKEKEPVIIPTITIQTQLLNANQVKISVTDNGVGISPDVQELMFDPFFTTKPVGQGIGIGLSISYQIISKNHGGQLLFDSQPGKGTKFMVIIPVNYQGDKKVFNN